MPAIREARPAATIRELEWLAEWMDARFQILGIRFGWDAIFGLLPGVGDTITAFISLYILIVASRFGLPRLTLLRMALNIAIEVVVGAIPLLGDLFDVAWRANVRNVALVKRHMTASPEDAHRAWRSDRLFVLAMALAVLILLCAALVLVAAAIMVVIRAINGAI